MTSNWRDLAASVRWRGIVAFAGNWIAPLEPSHGMHPSQLDSILETKGMHLPTAVREWYLLSANRPQDGLIVWILPKNFAAGDGVLWLLTDPDGINDWGIRIADLANDDPPVVTGKGNPHIACSAFTQFVATTIACNAIFDCGVDGPVELRPDAIHDASMLHIASCFGDVFVDGSLESATIVMFAYPANEGVFARSRTTWGRERLEKLQHKPV